MEQSDAFALKNKYSLLKTTPTCPNIDFLKMYFEPLRLVLLHLIESVCFLIVLCSFFNSHQKIIHLCAICYFHEKKNTNHLNGVASIRNFIHTFVSAKSSKHIHQKALFEAKHKLEIKNFSHCSSSKWNWRFVDEGPKIKINCMNKSPF